MKHIYQIILLLVVIVILTYKNFISIEENVALKHKIASMETVIKNDSIYINQIDSLNTEIFILSNNIGRYEFANAIFFKDKPESFGVEYEEILHNETE